LSKKFVGLRADLRSYPKIKALSSLKYPTFYKSQDNIRQLLIRQQLFRLNGPHKQAHAKSIDKLAAEQSTMALLKHFVFLASRWRQFARQSPQ
jgi:hypothetical protein